MGLAMGFRKCLVQSRTYAPTGNRDLEIAPTLRSWVGTGIKLRYEEPTFPKQIDRLNSYGISIAVIFHSLDPSLFTRLILPYPVS